MLRRLYPSIKKCLVGGVIGSTSALILAVGLINIPAVQVRIAHAATDWLSQRIGQSVVIQDIRTNGLTYIHANGVAMPELGVSIESVRIRYNLVRLLVQPHQPLGALTHVVVDQLPLDMTRHSDQRIELSGWVQSLVSRPARANSSTGFHGVLTITGVSGVIVDHRGWLKAPLPESFSRRYDQGSVYMDFRQRPVQVNASAIVLPETESESESVVKLNGEWMARHDYALTASIQGVSVATWGGYFFHQPGYEFLSGQASVTGKLSPHSDHPNVPEFAFDIYAEQAVVQLPFFEPGIHAITTHFRVTRDGMQFFPTTGVFVNQAVQAQGYIGFQTKTIDLTVTADRAPLSTLESVFPAVRLPVSGMGQSAVVRVHGGLYEPVVSGQVHVPAVQPLPTAMIRDAVVGYRYHQKALTVRALGGTVYGGDVSGEAVVTFSPDAPTQLNGSFTVTGSPLWGDGQVALSGPLSRYTVTAMVSPELLRWQGQAVDAIHAVAVVPAESPIEIPTASVVVNQSGVVHGQGQVSRQGEVALSFWGAGIPVWGGDVSVQSSVDFAISDVAANPWAVRVQASVSGKALDFPDIGVGDIQATVMHDAHRTVVTDGRLKILGGDIVLSGVRHDRRITADARMRVTAIPPMLAGLKWAPVVAKNGVLSGVAQVVYADGNWQASGFQEATAIRVNGVALDSVETHWQYSPDAWSLRQLTVAMPGTQFVADVRHTAAQQMVRVKAGSHIQLERIRPWLNQYGDFLGDCRFGESQWVLGHDAGVAIQADCESVMVNSLVLPAVSVAVQQKTDGIYVDRVRVRDTEGEFSLSGQVHPKTQAVTGTVQLKRMAWQRLRSLTQQAQTEFLALRHWVSLDSLKTERMDMPVVGYSGSRLWGGESAVSVFSSVVSLVEAQSDAGQQPGVWDRASATVSGELAVAYTGAQPWPVVTGALDVRSVVVGAVQVNRVRIDLARDADDGVVTATAEDIQLGRARLRAWHQTARLTPPGIVQFESGYSVDATGGQHPPVLVGQWPLMAMLMGQDAPVSVRIHVPGAVLGAVSVGVPAVQSLHSDGDIQLELGGMLSRLNAVVGSVHFRNTKGHVLVGGKRIPIGIEDAVVPIKNNRMMLSDLGVYWTQSDTQNRLAVSGPIDVALPGDSASVRMAVSIAPTQLHLLVPNRFLGQVALQSGRIVGQYPGRVTVHGDVAISHATITPQKAQSAGRLSEILALNMGVTIGPDVSISGYIISPTVLTVLSHYVDLTLAAGHPPISIQGPINRLSMTNYIQVSDGYVQVANRSFRLMQPKEQDQFFSQNNQKMGTNRIVFSGNSAPYLSFRALSLSDVRQQVVSKNVVRDDTQSAMVAVIEGGLQSPHAVWFEQYRVGYPFLPSSLPEFRHKYVLQTTVYDALSETNASDSNIFDVLLSDGASTDESGIDQSDTVRVEQMGQHRLNAFFNTQVFRPVERLIQQRTGLYQVQIDYNPGQAIIQSDESVFVQSGVGMNFIERLTDRLYARVRTDFGVYDDNRPLSEYELSYYLRRNLSVNYGQTRRLNIVDDGFVPRLFIKYNHVF